MAGVCLEKLPHSCGTGKGLQVYADPETGKVDGYCFACSKHVENPYGEEKTVDDIEMPAVPTEQDILNLMAEIDGYQTVDVRARKLRATYLKEFGIKTALSEEDGKTPTQMYFPMVVGGKVSGYYVKTLSKPSYTWSIGEVKKAEPFGWQQARRSGAYKLIIVEGKEDAVAVAAIFDRHGKEEYKPAIISLPNGTNSVKSSLSQIAEDAGRSFKEILICMDDDAAGKKAEEEALLIFPKAVTARLPYTDANECVLQGATQAAYKALAFNAARPKNTRLVVANRAFHEESRVPTPYGELTWPFNTMNDLLRNIRYGEVIYVGAGVKMGKSAFLNNVVAHFIKVHDIKVFVAKPEEELHKTYKLIAGNMVNKIFDDAKVEFDYDKFDEAGKMLDNKLIMLDLYQHVGWESLKADIISAAGEGCKAIFIDPITNLTNGINAAEANTKLQQIAQDLSALAKDLNVVIFVFCHLKSPEGSISQSERLKKYENGQYARLGNCPHEFGGDVMSSQFAGSRAMMRSCHLMLGLEGNKDENLPEEERSARYLRILEDREFGNSASVKIGFDPTTKKYYELGY